jgi:branched-chain amino acid transport system permease protein
MIYSIILMTVVHGGVYAMLAVGFSLVFGVARIINMAHTAFYMVAAYFMFYFWRTLDLDVLPSVALTILAVALLGVLTYRLFINRIREHPAAVLLMTVALAMILQEVIQLRFGGDPLLIPDLIRGVIRIKGVPVTYQHILTLGLAAVSLIAVSLFLAKTKLGIAIRAAANDAEVANLMGISIGRTGMVTMGIAAALAAVAGIAVAPLQVLIPGMWMAPLVMMLVIVVLGGLGSIKGSIIGAFIIALVENLVVFLMPQGAYLKVTFALLVLVIVLVVRPGGLFGITFEEERL